MSEHTSDRIRVVIADDHTLVREGTRKLLEQHDDMEVVGDAADGRAALAAIAETRPDVALVDIAMPELSGIEVTKQVKRSNPEVGVLILTVHDEDQYLFALLEAGAAGYLLKDVGGDELVHAIRSIHAGESVLHPAVARKVLDRFRPGSASDSPADRNPLSPRELQVLELAATGSSNKEIARELDLSVRTVHAHLGHVFEKLGVASRIEAVIHGLRRGWFELDELG